MVLVWLGPKKSSAWWDLNPRPPEYKADAIITEPISVSISLPGRAKLYFFVICRSAQEASAELWDYHDPCNKVNCSCPRFVNRSFVVCTLNSVVDKGVLAPNLWYRFIFLKSESLQLVAECCCGLFYFFCWTSQKLLQMVSTFYQSWRCEI